MKRMLFFFLMILSVGCFDGERGVLTELLVEPAGAPPVPVLKPLTAMIAAGTGSELVLSPIPAAVEAHLYHGSWEAALRDLARLLTIPEVSAETLGDRCDLDLHRRGFYDKYIDAGGIAIIGPSDRTSRLGVRDEWLYAAREVILAMTSERPGLRRVLSLEHEFGFRYVLLGTHWWLDESMPSELADHGLYYYAFFTPIGMGWLAAGGVHQRWEDVSNDWEEVFEPPAVVHQMAHAIDVAFDEYPHLFPDWGERLTAAYEAALAKALEGEGFFPADDAAMQNERDYWACGAEEWFTDMHAYYYLADPDEVQRAQMLEKDPLLYALLDEVFPVANLPQRMKSVEK